MSHNPATPGKPDKQAYLQENDLFRGLAPSEVAAMGARAPMRRVPAGTVFYAPDKPTEVLFILKEGRVRLYRLGPDGRSLTIAVLDAGSVFGEMAILGQELQETFAEALDPCLLCLMSRQDVKTMLLGDPRIALRIAEILGARLLDAHRQLSGFAFQRAPERLAALLLKRARRPALRLAGAALEIRHTHEELADMLGLQRETVTKILNEWSGRGMISLGRGRIRLDMIKEIESLASGGNARDKSN